MTDKSIALFREVVEAARGECDAPDSTPAVTQILVASYMERLLSPQLRAYVVINGLNSLVRRVFKSLGDGGDADARQMQLAEWPTTEMRSLVARIGHEMVYVPSRAEFVELVPDALTIPETREAGTYLIVQGEDTMRRGRLLISLAEQRDALSRQSYDLRPPRDERSFAA